MANKRASPAPLEVATRTAHYALIGSVVLTLSVHFPFNLPVMLLWVPVTLVFPQLATTGEEVTYGFAWVQIHKVWCGACCSCGTSWCRSPWRCVGLCGRRDEE